MLPIQHLLASRRGIIFGTIRFGYFLPIIKFIDLYISEQVYNKKGELYGDISAEKSQVL